MYLLCASAWLKFGYKSDIFKGHEGAAHFWFPPFFFRSSIGPLRLNVLSYWEFYSIILDNTKKIHACKKDTGSPHLHRMASPGSFPSWSNDISSVLSNAGTETRSGSQYGDIDQNGELTYVSREDDLTALREDPSIALLEYQEIRVYYRPKRVWPYILQILNCSISSCDQQEQPPLDHHQQPAQQPLSGETTSMADIHADGDHNIDTEETPVQWQDCRCWFEYRGQVDMLTGFPAGRGEWRDARCDPGGGGGEVLQGCWVEGLPIGRYIIDNCTIDVNVDRS
jgi:hypothetical protein